VDTCWARACAKLTTCSWSRGSTVWRDRRATFSTRLMRSPASVPASDRSAAHGPTPWRRGSACPPGTSLAVRSESGRYPTAQPTRYRARHEHTTTIAGRAANDARQVLLWPSCSRFGLECSLYCGQSGPSNSPVIKFAERSLHLKTPRLLDPLAFENVGALPSC
jgi:hypothetical protein